jgi:hypothetical protein
VLEELRRYLSSFFLFLKAVICHKDAEIRKRKRKSEGLNGSEKEEDRKNKNHGQKHNIYN